MRLSTSLISGVCIVLLTATSESFTQTPNEHLSVFEPLLANEWVGSLDDIELTKSLDMILDGKAIRERTNAPELGYTDETLFYWDPESKAIQLFKLTSRGHVIKGTVTTEGELIVYTGTAARPDEVISFKRTFELTSDGTLVDIYYNLENGEWVRGHHIEYIAKRKSTQQ